MIAVRSLVIAACLAAAGLGLLACYRMIEWCETHGADRVYFQPVEEAQ